MDLKFQLAERKGFVQFSESRPRVGILDIQWDTIKRKKRRKTLHRYVALQKISHRDTPPHTLKDSASAPRTVPSPLGTSPLPSRAAPPSRHPHSFLSCLLACSLHPTLRFCPDRRWGLLGKPGHAGEMEHHVASAGLPCPFPLFLQATAEGPFFHVGPRPGQPPTAPTVPCMLGPEPPCPL